MTNVKNLARDKIIRDALSAGKNAKQIDAELRKHGFKEKYNPLLYKGNWENLLPRAGEQFKNMGRDMSTAGGELIYNIGKPFKAAMDAPSGIKMEMFKRSLGDNSKVKNVLEGMAAGYGASKVISKIPGPVGKIGGLGGAVTGGLVGLAGGPEKFADMILEPYNMSVKPEIDLAKGLIKTGISKSNIPPQQLIEEYKAKRKDSDIRDVAQGALDNPAYALLDTAGAWAPIAGKGLAKTGRAVQKSKLPNVIKEIALSPEQREFNRELTNAIASGKVKSSNLYGGFNVLDNNLTANRENIAHYIITNQDNGLTKGELNLAKKLKTDLTAAEKKAIKEGYLNADDAKRNVVSQYVMQNILDESNLLQKDIDDILRGQPLRPEAKQMIDVKMANRIRKLVNEGSDLYV